MAMIIYVGNNYDLQGCLVLSKVKNYFRKAPYNQSGTTSKTRQTCSQAFDDALDSLLNALMSESMLQLAQAVQQKYAAIAFVCAHTETVGR